MHRRQGGRARWLIGIGAVALLVASVLQWWQLGGGQGELPATSSNGLGGPVGGAGFVVFLVGIATLLLLTLPYASEHPVPIERPISYLLLFVVGLAAYAWALVIVFQQQILPIPPTRGPGLWLAAVALVLFARGVFELFETHRPR